MSSLMVGLLGVLSLMCSGYCYWRKRRCTTGVDNLAKEKTSNALLTFVTIGAMDKGITDARTWQSRCEGFAFGAVLFGALALIMLWKGL